MSTYDEATYGELISDAYDDLYGDCPPCSEQTEMLIAAAHSSRKHVSVSTE